MKLAKKRIVIDAAMVRRGGGFTHLVNVLPELISEAPTTRFLVLVRGNSVASSLPESPNLDLEVLPDANLAQRIRFQFDEAARLSRRYHADLYYSVAETAPRGLACPLVVSFRNPNVFTSLEQNWGFYQSLRLPALRRAAIRTARRAHRVIFVSHDSARWIGDSIGLAQNRRSVIHHGIDPEPWRSAGPARNQERTGILSVSSIYRYKNFVRLIEAWKHVAEQRENAPTLTIVGDIVDRSHSRDMAAARLRCGPLAEKVHLAGAVPYGEMAQYYRQSEIFVFPSYLETFGHPLLEAMASELPVIAADINVFREVAGEAALYCDPFDTNSIAAAINRVLDELPLRERLIDSGNARVGHFTWPVTARRTLEVLTEVLSENAT
ncbi:MAG: glycosyltransferase family 1 protein [Myxococcota bacterium]|nr:glycosyltransferase family 1 protein [Myxococcota bacterium]